MRVVKVSAIWCGACLIMNKIWHNILEKYDIETLELDYDMDEEEVSKYQVGDVLPVFIFYKNEEEVLRITGEVSEEKLLEKMMEVGVLDEKDN